MTRYKRHRIVKSVRWINPFRNALKALHQFRLSVVSQMGFGCTAWVTSMDGMTCWKSWPAALRPTWSARSFDDAVTVFLGDYVDRGLGSMPVVEKLSRGEWPTPIVALAGNHEDLLLAFLEDARVLEAWRSLGGLETLHSYGVNVRLGYGWARFWRQFSKHLRPAFPKAIGTSWEILRFRRRSAITSSAMPG